MQQRYQIGYEEATQRFTEDDVAKKKKIEKIVKTASEQAAPSPTPTFKTRAIVRLGASTATVGTSLINGEDIARIDFLSEGDSAPRPIYLDVAQLIQLRELCDVSIKAMTRIVSAEVKDTSDKEG